MADKEFEPDDPMELVGVALPSDGGETARCLIEEYIREGFDDEQLLGLFRDPFYRLPNRLLRELGEDRIRGWIADARGAWGYWRGDDVRARLAVDEAKKRLAAAVSGERP